MVALAVFKLTENGNHNFQQ